MSALPVIKHFKDEDYKPAEYLTPEQIHKRQEENLSKRHLTLKICNTIVDDRELVIKKCAEDIFYWLENFAVTYDPRLWAKPSHLPFIAYDFQKDTIKNIVDCVLEGKDLLIEKSRDMGVTWCVLYVFQWFWQFHNGYNFLAGSNTAIKTDTLGDPSSLFEKLRYSIKMQPNWLLPAGFNKKKHLNSNKIVNPENANSITGEAPTSNFGRQGRYTAILFDEYAQWEHDSAAWGASRDATPCRIVVSTPYGTANTFYRLRKKTKIKVLTLHWSLHPRKTENVTKNAEGKWVSVWYLEQLDRAETRAEIGRELDIDYLTSREGRVYVSFDSSLNVKPGLYENWTGEKIIVRGWDFDLHPAAIWANVGEYGIRILKEIAPDDRPATETFANRVIYNTNLWFPGWKIFDICDIAGKRENAQTNKTDIEILQSLGIFPEYELVPVEAGIKIVTSKIERQGQLLVDKDCELTIEMFEGGYYRKAQKENDPTSESENVVKKHPFCDIADCIRYICWKYFKPLDTVQHIDYENNKKKARARGEDF